MYRSVLCLAAVSTFAMSALADEVWSLPSGNQLVYERDAGDTAILSYTPEVGLEQGLIFVPGMAGAESRGTYQGYWVEAEGTGPACAAALTDAEGNTWSRWGSAEVKFASPGFPSKIAIKRGTCFGPAKKSIKGKPVVGAGLQ